MNNPFDRSGSAPSRAGRGAATTPSLTVVIATLGRPRQLEEALTSLQCSTTPPEEVLVVDGSAEGDALSVVQSHDAAAPYPVRHFSSPPGLTRQRNVGLDAAAGDVVVFLDDDAQVSARALHEVGLAYADPSVVGVTARVVEPHGNAVGGRVSLLRRLYNVGGRPGTFTPAGYPRRLQDESVRQDIEFMQGAFMSARVAQARQLRFDERLPGYGLAEDEDFSRRLSRQGRIRYLGDVQIQHDNSGFAGRDKVAFSRAVVRHRRYLFHKNFEQSPGARVHFGLLIAVLVVHRLLNREFRPAATLAATALRGEELGLGPQRR